MSLLGAVTTFYASRTLITALFDSLTSSFYSQLSIRAPGYVWNSASKVVSKALDSSNQELSYQYHNLEGINSQLKDKTVEDENITKIELSNPKDVPLVQLEFCHNVLKLVEQKLQSIQILQFSDLNVSLSHLSDAKHALKRNKSKRFKYFIEQSYLKAREAQYKVPDCISKIYVYSLLIFDGFLLFSDFGQDYVSGLSFIKKLLCEIQLDIKLNKKLNEALSSYFYWTKEQKILIAHCCLFSTKMSALVRCVANKIENNIQQKSIMRKKYNNDNNIEKEELLDSKMVWNVFQDGNKILKSSLRHNTTSGNNSSSDSECIMNEIDEDEIDELLDVDKWSPDIWNGNFFGRVFDDNSNSKGVISSFPIVNSSNYLSLFELNEISNRSNNLWYCNSNNLVYVYNNKKLIWTILNNSLLYDYYYKILIKDELFGKFNYDKYIRILTQEYFIKNYSKYLNLNKNKLTFISNWKNILNNNELLMMLFYYLTIDTKKYYNSKKIKISKKHLNDLKFLNLLNHLEISHNSNVSKNRNNLNNSSSHLDTNTLSDNNSYFGMKSMKFICNLIIGSNNLIKILHLVNNNISNKMLNLFSYSILSISPLFKSQLIDISFYGNKLLSDDSLSFFLLSCVPKKLPYLKKLCLSWTNISNSFCISLYQFYKKYNKHTLHKLILAQNKKIDIKGLELINKILTTFCKDRKEMFFNLSDCGYNNMYSPKKKFDKRLIVNH